MSVLLNGDCLELMKDLDDNSVDLIFTDLPYGQVSCEWDKKIDFKQMWEQFMRIKKLNTPIFFCCSTKFGVEIINSAPKKCPFRYDIVWVKSAPCGFLCARKMPMKKHEMLYVFYEKLPFYDLSSHQHKFIKSTPMGNTPDLYGRLWDKNGNPYVKEKIQNKYTPPLPVSVVREDVHKTAYGTNTHYHNKEQKNGESIYDPPLPTSVQKEEKDVYDAKERFKNGKLSKHPRHLQKGDDPIYDPPLPNSILEISSQRGKHSTQKPLDLMKWVLKYYSKEGDVVLDPTMGSGSTGVACKEMNRNFIGMEMNPEIYEVAVSRIEG